jgi:4a-hydroxytetrahydrobiopterin dehydratase
MANLTAAQIAAELQHLPGWSLTEGALVRDFQFPDFLQAMAFVNRVAVAAEQAGHHPDIDIRYNKVRLALVTHSAGGITDKDVALAGQIGRAG